MKSFAINTLGCKVNQYETQQIRELLEKFSLVQVDSSRPADLIIVNTCCITHIASAKSRQSIRKLKRSNPDSILVVTGCLPAGPDAELGDLPADAIIVQDKSKLTQTLNSIVYNNIQTQPDNNCTQQSLPTLSKYAGQRRAFLKVQDGCDGFCSYCIVPKIRNQIYNKPMEQILQEAQQLVYAGHAEIVLTGIFLGAYNQKTVRRKKWKDNINPELANLVDQVAQVPGLKRLRLSSLEPADVTQPLLDIMTKHDNIMPHLHLPLQSGSAAILKKMGRQYNADQFRQMIEVVNRHFDRPAITTDIIVGFPSETDKDFDDTVEMANFAKFAKMHVFSYSQRKGTAAMNMEPKISSEIIAERSKFLRRLDAKLGREFRMQFVGEKVSAILETTSPAKGRSERYFMVHFDSPPANCRQGDILTGTLKANGINALSDKNTPS